MVNWEEQGALSRVIPSFAVGQHAKAHDIKKLKEQLDINLMTVQLKDLAYDPLLALVICVLPFKHCILA